ncbi:MAG: hypothetical protein KBF28_05370 [Gemmatimonadales bacterium]|nr:hypothetical protein [Gemmatimonadales bacterium]
MPTISQSACKRLLFGERLTVWGVHMRETYTPGGHGDGQRGAQKVYHYPPAALDWLADISEAFAHLSPDTPLRGIRFSTLTRQRFNPHQWAVWYFYVDGLGDLSKADKAKVVQLAGESKMERGLRDWRGDERVGAKLGVGGRQANRLRCEAVGLLAVRLAGKWDRRAA